MASSVSIVWFRADLRLTDNPALLAAIADGAQILPVYIWAPEEEGRWSPGGASRWWLHQSLLSLDADLKKLGGQLIIREGKSLNVLQSLLKETGAKSVFWNRRYEPFVRERDTEVQDALTADGITVGIGNASLLLEPEQISNKEGNPFKVFTPYWKYCSTNFEPQPAEKKPKKIAFFNKPIKSLPLEELELEPRINWASGMREFWKPGEQGAGDRLKQFLHKPAKEYAIGRDRPDRSGVSMMSPYLHFGEIGPRQIWHEVQGLSGSGAARHSIDTYLKELGWREFAYYILFHFPQTAEQPLREQFNRFPWSDDAHLLRLWQKGQTGYPIVDAGMRQLWKLGWMHNRVRMIVASFLTKHLLVSWSHGAEWFWDTLVDADLASNTLGWQWASGCGADAAPYFRIFNPELQGEKFDPEGEYVKHWVPELTALPPKWIHKPWKAPPLELLAAGVELGTTYPKPIVDHATARAGALTAFAHIKMCMRHYC